MAKDNGLLLAWPEPWSRVDDRGLARFVTKQANRWLQLPISRFDLASQLDQRRIVARAIYDALKDQNIRYELEEYHPSQALQTIRTPPAILNGEGEGTCLDLAALYCGLCLANELLPIMIVIEGHALAAVSLTHGVRDWNGHRPGRALFATDPLIDVQPLRDMIDDESFVAVECTGFAHSEQLGENIDDRPEAQHRTGGVLTFDQAVHVGRRQLDRADRPFKFAIDVAVAHYGWRVGPHSLEGALEQSGGRAAQTLADHEASLELSPDVQEHYRTALSSGAAGVKPPTSWSLYELSRLRHDIDAHVYGPSKVANTLTALCDGLRAKRVFLDIGGSALGLGLLQVMYKREIGAWPTGSSADALLVLAADTDLVDRRTIGTGPLGALARFMISVAAQLAVAPDSCQQLASWVSSRGHQIGDAQQYYMQRYDSAAWLHIDLGDEPNARTATTWPMELTWTRCTKSGEVADRFPCDGTEEGLRGALREVLRRAPARRLLVDFAVPYELLDRGIERWAILEVDGEFEELEEESRPRLRWSRRRHDLMLHNKLLERTAMAAWETKAETLPDDVLSDHQKLKQWIRADPRRACLIGGPGIPAVTDPLKIILRAGYGFLIWLPPGLKAEHRQEISAAISKVPFPARRQALPDELPSFADHYPAIIWDDPLGREGFSLPPLVMPEC